MKRFRMKAYLLLTLLLAVYILPGCGGDAGNGHWDKPGTAPPGTLTAPTITETFPADLEENAATDVVLSATFSKPMTLLTMVDTNFTVQASGPPLGALLPGTVVYDDITMKATFTPDVPLDPDTFYTVTVTVDATDIDGNPLVVPAVGGLPVPNPWTFKTAPALSAIIIPGATCPVDASPTIPTVTMSDPTSGNQFATTSTMDVANNGKLITATFSLEMDPTTIASATAPLTFTIKETLSGNSVAGTVTMDATNKIATFTTVAALLPDTAYTASITTDAMSAGTPPTALSCPYEWNFKTVNPAATGLAPINLGLAESFGIAATTGVLNTGATTVNGDVVLDANTTCNGVTIGSAGTIGDCNPIAPIINGTVISPLYPDAGVQSGAVKAALQQTYLDLTPANLPGATTIPAGTTMGDLAGNALVELDNLFYPGVYWAADSILITGDLTLDAQGDPDAVFVFQSWSTIGTAARNGVVDTHIILTGGAKASNIWWQAGSDATLETYSEFKGNILAYRDIVMKTGATSCGRLFAGASTDGRFTFDNNIVSVPGNTNAPAGCE